MKKLFLLLLLPIILLSSINANTIDERKTTIGYLNGFGIFKNDAWK